MSDHQTELPAKTIALIVCLAVVASLFLGSILTGVLVVQAERAQAHNGVPTAQP
jgi:hypothetical protein